MAFLPENTTWESGVYQIEITDPIKGGPDGISNLQGKQLTNRTAYLKDQVDTLVTTTEETTSTQFYDDSVNFDGSVADNDLVYKSSSDDIFYKALAENSEKSLVVGVADVTNSRVKTSGILNIGHSYDTAENLYLSDTNPGEVTNLKTSVPLGLSLGNGVLLLRTLGDSSGSSSNTDDEFLLYYSLLEGAPFNNLFYDNFQDTGVVTPTNTVIDPYWSSYDMDAGASLVSNNLLDGDTTTYYRFMFHVDSTDNSVLDSFYSIDGGSTWTAVVLDEVITLTSGYSDIQFKIEATGPSTVYSFGLLYNFTSISGTSDTRMLETHTVTSDHTSPYEMILPNKAIYTVDGKSLEIYVNRVRLIPGIDYEEVDQKTVRFLINLENNDVIVFTEKYGFVDTSVENEARLDYEHNSTGEHIFKDFVTGDYYQLIVTNGTLDLLAI